MSPLRIAFYFAALIIAAIIIQACIHDYADCDGAFVEQAWPPGWECVQPDD